jgi:hypothetical protein
MAVARRLDAGIEAVFFTLSAAAPVVREQGFFVEYLGSYNAPGAGSHLQWSERLGRRFAAIHDETRPAVLVFDGAHPYPAAISAIRAHARARDDDDPLITVWSRRPLWQPERGRRILPIAAAFDLVLEPGELAADDDAGPTVERREEAVRVDPIVFCDPAELPSREQAERDLGLEPGRVNALVALGQGPEVDEAVGRTLVRLAREPDVQVAALESSIAGRLDLPPRVTPLRDTYPVSRHYRAFDFAVSAAGYNAFHELVALSVPTAFVPMPRELDDQAARARYAERTGVGLACDGPDSDQLEDQVELMLDPAVRERMAARARALDPANGAGQAAALLSRLVADGRDALADLPRPLPGRARMQATFAAAAASALIRHPSERRRSPSPELVCIALDTPPTELAAEIDRLVATVGDPARVLVITDSTDLATLRRAGVAFEYVPPRTEVARHLPDVDYDTWLEARLDAALAARGPARTERLGR